MLGVQKLVFPRLVTLNQEAVFKHNPPKQRVFLYRLDWSYLKKLHAGQHRLPDPWDQIFSSMMFALPTPYLREIRHQTKYAQMAWDREIGSLKRRTRSSYSKATSRSWCRRVSATPTIAPSRRSTT